MHRAKSGRTFYNRDGLFIYFFCTPTGHGLSFSCPVTRSGFLSFSCPVTRSGFLRGKKMLRTTIIGYVSCYCEFRLCADKLETGEMVMKECFDQHLLTLVDGSTRYRIPPENMRNSYHEVSIQQPIKGDIDRKNCVFL